MTDYEILSELFLDSSLVPLGKEYGNPIVRLYEPDTSGSEACIYHMPPDAFVIKADSFPAPKELFRGLRSECKRADFIIISPAEKVVLYIELKTGPMGSNFIEKQLKGAACVFAYCKEVGQRFWGQCNFLEGYEHRFIGIVKTRLNLRPSRQQKNAGVVHNSPDNFLKESSPNHLEFRKLAAL